MLRKTSFCRFLPDFFHAILAGKLGKGESRKHTLYAVVDMTILCFVNSREERSCRFLSFRLCGLRLFCSWCLTLRFHGLKRYLRASDGKVPFKHSGYICLFHEIG